MAAMASCNRATFTLTRHECSAGLSSPKLALDFSVGRVSRFRTKQSFLSIASSKSSSRLYSKFNAVSVSAPPESFSIARVVESLINKIDLSEEEAEAVLDNLLRGGANEAQISAFLVLLRAKGETYEEITGLAKAMIKRCVRLDGLTDAIDIVGTGGDGANTINISTGACILAAACGARVAKQGNRSSSSACGSADVLEALGVTLDLGPEVHHA